MSALLDTAIEAASRAGELLLERYGSVGSIRRKTDGSFVSETDRRSEKLIIETIRERFPAHRIRAEESGDSGTDEDYLWLVDPLDGTHNFIRDIPIFGVCIGIMRGEEFTAGVINLPWDRTLCAAEKGAGAFAGDVRLRVSKAETLAGSTVAFDSTLCDDVGRRIDVLHRVARSVFNVRMFGASAQVMSYLARGSVDGVVEFDDKPWDFAAGVCLIREAGGIVTDIEGGQLGAHSRGYVAGNPSIHTGLREVVHGSPVSVKGA